MPMLGRRQAVGEQWQKTLATVAALARSVSLAETAGTAAAAAAPRQGLLKEAAAAAASSPWTAPVARSASMYAAPPQPAKQIKPAAQASVEGVSATVQAADAPSN